MTLITSDDQRRGLAKIKWPLRLTWAGMWAEALVQALWPLVGVILVVLAALILGLHDLVAVVLVKVVVVLDGVQMAHVFIDVAVELFDSMHLVKGF